MNINANLLINVYSFILFIVNFVYVALNFFENSNDR